MKTILSSRRRHYVASVSIFLLVVVAVALIAGMAGCTGDGGEVPPIYTLTTNCTFGGAAILGIDVISEEPLGVHPLGVYPTEFTGASYGTASELEWDFSDGGVNTTTMTPTHNYLFHQDTPTDEDGLRVDLKAVGFAGYSFVEWAGDIETVADPYSASTSMRLNGDYQITAKFEPNTTQFPPGSGNLTGSYTLAVNCTLGGMVILGFDVISDEPLGVHPLGVYPTEFTGASYGTASELEWDFSDGGVNTTTMTPTHNYLIHQETPPNPSLDVDLKTIPWAGYSFVAWTGDVATISDCTSTNTSIILDGDYFITANFEANIA